MLGPVGKLAKAALAGAGYDLHRSTEFENRLMRSYWGDWFSKDPMLFARVYAKNRQSLGRVQNWADDIDNSLWRYGVPEIWSTGERGLDKTVLDQVEPEVTYTDLIGFVASHIRDLTYLEIGVSVGKNFWQIIELFPDADIFGLDVEEPNPSLVRLFERVEAVWQGPEQVVDTLSGNRTSIRLTHYLLHRKNGKPVTYVKGDQFDRETWSSMTAKFNFVFSDGVHSGRAVLDEFDHLKACDLLDTSGRFAMYWDDLVNVEMQSAFERNARLLGEGRYSLHPIHGTYGERRMNGLFANFSATSAEIA